MKILGYTCILLVACYVLDFYKRILDSFLGILLMDCASCLKFLQSDFGCGFLVFGYSRQLLWGLVLYVLFGLGLKFLEFGFQFWGYTHCLCVLGGVWSELRTGFTSKNDFDVKKNPKFSSCECGFLENRFMIEKVDENKECVDESDDGLGCTSKSDFEEDRFMIEKLDKNKECADESDDEHECYDEDKECDVVKLRKLVKIERVRANAAYLELEKERMAAATAAEETLAMILRLQHEKSVIEMEAHQYHRLAEEKQLHDQEVIESLRWIATRCESARIQLEDQVRSLKQKVELHLKDDEGDQSEGVNESSSFHNFNFEDALEDRLVSSLDLALSSCINESDLAECPFETPSQQRN